MGIRGYKTGIRGAARGAGWIWFGVATATHAHTHSKLPANSLAAWHLDVEAATRLSYDFEAAPPNIADTYVGDGWGCVKLHDKSHYCWEAPYAELAPGAFVVASRIAWLDDRLIRIGPDRLCVEQAGMRRCWLAPEFIRSARRAPEGSWSYRPEAAADGAYEQDPIPIRFGAWSGCSQGMCWTSRAVKPVIKICEAGMLTVPCDVVKPTRLRALGEIPGSGEPMVGDLFGCLRYDDGLYCVGASRDGFFGTKGQCPRKLLEAWPTATGAVAAPNAKCASDLVRVGTASFNGNFASAGVRGICLDDGELMAKDRQFLVTYSCFGAVAPATKALSRVRVGLGDEPSACGIDRADSIGCWGAGYNAGRTDDAPIPVHLAIPMSNAIIVRRGHSEIYHRSCAIHRNCGKFETPLAPCAARDAPIDLETLLAGAASLEGTRVTIRGSLKLAGREGTPAMMTVCGPFLDYSTPDILRGGGRNEFCCRENERAVVVTNGRSFIALDGMTCSGDRSRLCCSIPALGQEVMATGTLRFLRDHVAGIGRDLWILTEPQLCERSLAPEKRYEDGSPG